MFQIRITLINGQSKQFSMVKKLKCVGKGTPQYKRLFLLFLSGKWRFYLRK
jgi:hypothetical protein